MSNAVENCKNLAFSSTTSFWLLYMTYNDVRRHVIQQLAVIGCNTTTSPQLVEIQTPLKFDLLWTCGFAVESTANPQHLDMSRCCGFFCGFGVQLVVQQIHNKSHKWSLGFSAGSGHCGRCLTGSNKTVCRVSQAKCLTFFSTTNNNLLCLYNYCSSIKWWLLINM